MGTMTITRRSEAGEDVVAADPAPQALLDQPVPPAEVLIKEARRRQRRRWAFVAGVLGLVGGLVTGVAVSSGSPPPPPRSPHASSASTPGAPVDSLSTLPWPAQAVASTLGVRSIVATTGNLYWLTGKAPTGCRGASTATVPVRFDPITRATSRGAPLAACTEAIAVAGGSVWALEVTGTSLVVASLDPRTLAVGQSETFPQTTRDPACALQACAALAGGPGRDLWVSNGGEVWRLDPASGAVESSFVPVSTVAALAPGLTGEVLYTSGADPTGGGAAVDEYAVASGTLVGRATLTQCLQSGPAQLAAGSSDVWVSCRTGMAGTASELSRTGLAAVSHPVTPTGSNGPFFHMMGVTVETSDGPLWLSSAGDLACADPATGTLLAKETLPTSFTFGAHAATGGHLYAAVGNTGVVSVSAPVACFGNGAQGTGSPRVAGVSG